MNRSAGLRFAAERIALLVLPRSVMMLPGLQRFPCSGDNIDPHAGGGEGGMHTYGGRFIYYQYSHLIA